jgi:hypothetical protein
MESRMYLTHCTGQKYWIAIELSAAHMQVLRARKHNNTHQVLCRCCFYSKHAAVKGEQRVLHLCKDPETRPTTISAPRLAYMQRARAVMLP